jgi:hypothetical protein
MTVLVSGSRAGSDVFLDGSQINLAMTKGVTVTGGGSLWAGASLSGFLRPYYGWDVRWTGGQAPGWVTIDLGRTWQVSSFKLYFHGVITAVTNLTVKTSPVAQSDVEWAALTPAYSFSGSIAGAVPSTGWTANGVAGTFPAVSARYIRFAYDTYAGYSQMIMVNASLYGPNGSVPIDNTISLAQSTWAGATASWSDPWGTLTGAKYARSTTIQPCPTVIDDFYILRQSFPNADGGGTYPVGPPPDPLDLLAVEPTRFFITLNDSYLVQRVGWTSMTDNRRPMNVDIYTSPDTNGLSWVLQQTVSNAPTGYFETNVVTPTMSRCVRIDVLNTYGPVGDARFSIPDCYVGEIFIYGKPPPRGTVVLVE